MRNPRNEPKADCRVGPVDGTGGDCKLTKRTQGQACMQLWTAWLRPRIDQTSLMMRCDTHTHENGVELGLSWGYRPQCDDVAAFVFGALEPVNEPGPDLVAVPLPVAPGDRGARRATCFSSRRSLRVWGRRRLTQGHLFRGGSPLLCRSGCPPGDDRGVSA